LIRAGRVRVDGQLVTNPALRVAAQLARIEVDGQPLQFQRRVHIVLNKPLGTLSAAVDPRGRRTVLELLGEMEQRLYPAGRLDADTQGLLVITNDGELTLRLTHPRYGVEKVYEAEVKGRPSPRELQQLERGLMLEDGPTGPAKVRLLRAGDRQSRVELIIHSGRKRQVRRMLKAVGHPVVSLVRTRLGPLTLEGLRPGEWRRLTSREIAQLRRACGLQPRSAEENDRGG
jgi:pseudouridine synthase